jgi:alpha-glucosidase
MFGADTCGFADNTDMELCNRWMQLSAFFPFYRNHNILGAISQEAYRWSSVIDASKSAMSIRYQLLPYIYTLFYHAHIHAETVMRALAWEFLMTHLSLMPIASSCSVLLFWSSQSSNLVLPP